MTKKESSPVSILRFVKEAYSQDTGGGFECDVFLLDDGTLLVISEDAIVLYPSEEDWENPRVGSGSGMIVRGPVN